MDPERLALLHGVRDAFRGERGPARCRDPRHCAECAEADRMLLDLDPIDLTRDDLEDCARNWIFSFVSDEGLRWLIPGIVRVALEQNPPEPSLLCDLLGQRPEDVLTEDQWLAIQEFQDRCPGL